MISLRRTFSLCMITKRYYYSKDVLIVISPILSISTPRVRSTTILLYNAPLSGINTIFHSMFYYFWSPAMLKCSPDSQIASLSQYRNIIVVDEDILFKVFASVADNLIELIRPNRRCPQVYSACVFSFHC